LRFLNLITNGIFFYVYWWLVGYLYPTAQRQSWLWVVTAVCSAPLYFVMLTLAWHDHLLITLCLTASVLFLQYLDGYKFGNVLRERLLYGAVLLLSLAVITKYNALLFALGLGVAVWSDRSLRRLITWRRGITVLGIFCLVFLPVLLWNVQYDFPSFHYYLTRSVNGGTWLMRLLEPVGFGVISLLMLSPFNCWLVYAGWQKRHCLPSQTVYLQLAIAVFLVSTGILLGVSLLSTAYYYWNITAYLLLFPLIPLAVSQAEMGKVVNGALLYGMVFALLFVVNYTVLPIASVFDPHADPDGRMLYGWEQVKAYIDAIAPKQELVVTTDYRSAGAIAYALPDRKVTALSQRISQFDFPSLSTGEQFILLWDDWHPLTPWHRSQIGKINSERMAILPIYRWGVLLKNYYLAPAQGLYPLPKLWKGSRN
jgi:hypothetical protein